MNIVRGIKQGAVLATWITTSVSIWYYFGLIHSPIWSISLGPLVAVPFFGLFWAMNRHRTMKPNEAKAQSLTSDLPKSLRQESAAQELMRRRAEERAKNPPPDKPTIYPEALPNRTAEMAAITGTVDNPLPPLTQQDEPTAPTSQTVVLPESKDPSPHSRPVVEAPPSENGHSDSVEIPFSLMISGKAFEFKKTMKVEDFLTGSERVQG